MLIVFWQKPSSSVVRFNLKFICLLMVVAGAPALCYLILYGPVIHTVLPDIGGLFRGMLSLVQAMTVGLSGSVLIVLVYAIPASIRHYSR